jgi:translation initiation factor 4E
MTDTMVEPTSLNQEKHETNTSWIIWYHNPSDLSWGISSYRDVLEINSLEDFIVLKNSWKLCLPDVNEGMFFMMRKFDDENIIYPQWEDQNNKDGGYWSFKVDKTQAEEVWFKLCMYMLGEQIPTNSEDAMEINGISISPKKNFCIVKIWNKNRNNCAVDFLSNELTFLDMNEVKYTLHEDNIVKDQTKVKKYQERKKGYF